MQKLVSLFGIPYSGRSLTASSGWGVHGYDDLIKYILRAPHGVDQPVHLGLDNPSAVSGKWVMKYLKSAKGYVSGHAAYSGFIHAILDSLGYKTIIMIRHPGALLYSWANFIGEPRYYWKKAQKAMLPLSVESRFRIMLTGGSLDNIYYPSLREILLRFEGWFWQKEVLVVRFEDLIGDQGGGKALVQRKTITQVLSFLNIEKSENELDRIQDKLFGGTHTFRIGNINTWADHIPIQLQKDLQNSLKELSFLRKLGYGN